jgi:glucokinase
MPVGFVGAVDLGATNVRVAIVSEDGDIEARRSGPLPAGSPAEVIVRLARTIDELVRGVWVGAKVAAIGLALPGAVDAAGGTVESIANMPGWNNVPLARLLSEARGVPVAIENDANAAAVGEGWTGAAKGLRDHVFVALGTGVGAGIVLDGRLHRGSHLLAGEIAFFPMTREQLCAGDWQHNLESTVGGRAAGIAATRLLGERAKAAELFEAARAGDAKACGWLAELRDYLAMAVADIASLLDPEAIVFGGGMAVAQGEWFLAPIREMALRCIPGKPRILLSTLGEDAQIIGAAKLAYAALAQGD